MLYLDKLSSASIGSEFILDPSQECKDYKNEFPVRKKCRDAVEGATAIKKADTTYLPRPEKLSDTDWYAYKQRAQFVNFSARTVEAYIGMIYRKDPLRDYSKNNTVDPTLRTKYDPFFDVVTFDGLTAEQFANTVTEEVIVTNKVGVLIDYPKAINPAGDPIVTSKLEVEALGLKPLFSIYKFESIINWWAIYERTRPIPVLFVLKEYGDSIDDASLVAEKQVRYRILYLENYKSKDTKERKYKQIIIKSVKDAKRGKTQHIVEDVIYPMIDGKYLNYIPFYVLTDQGIQYTNPKEPLISDLVDVNIGHYVNSADLENSLHWTGIKTAIFPGWNIDIDGAPYLGKCMSVKAGPDSKPFILESQSDSGIADEMVKKESRMAVLGAEKIAQTGRYIASATTAQISSISESSVLSDMSKSISEALGRLFTLQLEWYGEEGVKVSYQLVTDYYADTLTGEELLQIVEAMQAGGISFDTMFHILRKKETYPPGRTLEQERDQIKQDMEYLFSSINTKDKTNSTAVDVVSEKQVV